MFRIVKRPDKTTVAEALGTVQHDEKVAEVSHPQTPRRIVSRPGVEKSPNIVSPVAKAEIAKNVVQDASVTITKKPTTVTPRPLMDASIRLIDDDLELVEALKEFLLSDNKKYSVIGAIGAQGTGKSTILSMLAGNSPADMYRQYIFRPCAREAVESCRYQTQKISVYVSHKTRTFFLDCQPLNCVSLLEDFARSSASHRSGKSNTLHAIELETLQLLLLLANVCHTLLLCTDWFIDMAIVRRLMRTELFPSLLLKQDCKQRVNLVVLHQRAKSHDLHPALVHERMRILDCMFADSTFNVRCGITMFALGFRQYESFGPDDDLPPVSYIVLGEMRPRTRMTASDQQFGRKNFPQTDFKCSDPSKGAKGADDYGAVIAQLRTKIFHILPSYAERSDTTELQWFTQLGAIWAKIREESVQLTDDGCTLKQQRSFYAADPQAAALSKASFGTSMHHKQRQFFQIDQQQRRSRQRQQRKGGGRQRNYFYVDRDETDDKDKMPGQSNLSEWQTTTYQQMPVKVYTNKQRKNDNCGQGKSRSIDASPESRNTIEDVESKIGV